MAVKINLVIYFIIGSVRKRALLFKQNVFIYISVQLFMFFALFILLTAQINDLLPLPD